LISITSIEEIIHYSHGSVTRRANSLYLDDTAVVHQKNKNDKTNTQSRL